MVAIKKKGLGRGLEALLGEKTQQANSTTDINRLPLTALQAGKYQPRQKMEAGALQELAESIREQGVMQPLLVRLVAPGKYEIIAGERRFRAATIAGLKEVPVLVSGADDQAAAAMALVENIQRENLDAIEVAISYKRLIDECNLTQEQLSEKVSKQRSTVTNYLRLLKLPTTIQLSIREGKISMGQARTLINIENSENQLKVFNSIINEDLSVREAEELVRTMKNKKGSSVKKATNLSIEYQKLQDALHKHFSKKVFVTGNDKGSGKIVIPFKSSSELDLLIKKLDL